MFDFPRVVMAIHSFPRAIGGSGSLCGTGWVTLSILVVRGWWIEDANSATLAPCAALVDSLPFFAFPLRFVLGSTDVFFVLLLRQECVTLFLIDTDSEEGAGIVIFDFECVFIVIASFTFLFQDECGQAIRGSFPVV